MLGSCMHWMSLKLGFSKLVWGPGDSASADLPCMHPCLFKSNLGIIFMLHKCACFYKALSKKAVVHGQSSSKFNTVLTEGVRVYESITVRSRLYPLIL